MDILVLGGGGLLSAAAVRAFRAAGHDVTVLTRGRTALPPDVHALRADRTRRDEVRAALAHRRFDFTADFLAFDAADVECLFHEPIGILGRYALVSSGQVYLVTADRQPPFPEESADRPLMSEPEAGSADHGEWAYGMGKRRAESALRALRQSHGVRGIALRLPVVQGAADHSRRLWAYLERMRDGAPVLLPDAGTQRVRFVWTEDVARALVMLAEASAWPDAHALNLAQPDEPTLAEFLGEAASAAGLAPTFVPISSDELRDAGLHPAFSPYSGPWCSRPLPLKAQATLGWVGTSSKEYLPAVVQAHLEHPGPSHPGYAGRERERAWLAARR